MIKKFDWFCYNGQHYDNKKRKVENFWGLWSNHKEINMGDVMNKLNEVIDEINRKKHE
jgi:hypothetical protein